VCFKELFKLEKITLWKWLKIYSKPVLKIIIFRMKYYSSQLNKKILKFDKNKLNKLSNKQNELKQNNIFRYKKR